MTFSLPLYLRLLHQESEEGETSINIQESIAPEFRQRKVAG